MCYIFIQPNNPITLQFICFNWIKIERFMYTARNWHDNLFIFFVALQESLKILGKALKRNEGQTEK